MITIALLLLILLLILQAALMPLMISFLHIVEQQSVSRGIEPEQ